MPFKQTGLAFFMMLLVTIAYGQSSKDVGPPTPPAPRYQASKQKTGFFAKAFKKEPKSDREAFHDRMKDLQKQKAKEAKLAEKPQYSNPLYFGHKKPPKKRPLGKRKLCKVCHIVH